MVQDERLFEFVKKIENDKVLNKAEKSVKDLKTLPIFSLTKQAISVPKNNSAFLAKNLSHKLTEQNAPIFATFGYKDPRYYIPLRVKEKQIFALIDSGSTKTYVNKSAAKLLGTFDKSESIMKAANCNIIRVDGIKDVTYNLCGMENNIPTRYIKSLDYDCIFGTDALKSFGMSVNFGTGECSLPGGKSWKVDFPDEPIGLAYPTIDSISALCDGRDSRFFIDISIKGKTVKALVDSGATRTYLGPVFEPILEKSIIPVTVSVRLADNSIEPVVGEVNTQLSIGKTRKGMPVRLVHSLVYDCILGMDFLKLFKLKVDFGKGTWQLPENPSIYHFDPVLSATEPIYGECAGLSELSNTQRKRVDQLIKKYIRAPGKKLAVTNLTKHQIELLDPTPIRQNPRRMSPAVLKEAHKLVDEWLAEDVIEPCKSPWCSPPVMARKQDGSWRLCVDYRKLNAKTKKHAHPLPNIDSLLDRFTSARYITKIDMTWAFLQVPVDENCRDFTAFSVPGRGQFRFKRMPFGMTNSPATYQAMMDMFIQNLPRGAEDHVFAYLDDLCIVAETFEEHLHWLEIILKALKEANLQVNPTKSEFCCAQVKYLGYIIDSKGLQVDPEKTKAIDEYPPPKNLRQLRRFLGMVGWYARFLENLSEDKVLLCDLLKKDSKWQWTSEHQQAFERVKKNLVSAPVLIRPDFSQPFQLHCDASDYAIGAVLTQEIKGEQHPVIFVNRLLTSAERKFTTTEKECKAVLWAVEKLRPYLEGSPVTVYTDHSSLVWLAKLSNPSGRLARWAMSLSALDLTIVHRPGAQNQVPDALSRAFEDLCSAEELSTGDAWYVNKFTKVRDSPDKFPNWKIEGGQLFIHKPDPWVDPLIGDRDAWKLVVPEELRPRILKEVHDSPTSGHFGRFKTIALLSRHYYWLGMQVDAARYVKSCLECQRVKTPQTGPVGLMGIKSHQEPWQVVVSDLQGPFPPSMNQFRYLLVAVDDLTKFVVVKPLRTADGKRVWEALNEKVFNIFGYPKILHADNGNEFDNGLIKKNCEERKIEFSTIPPYHPQANPTERTNRSIKTLLRTFVEENHRKWDEHVYEIAYAINNAPQESLSQESARFSPAFLNFGRNLELPGSEFAQSVPVPNATNRDPKFWLDRIRRLGAYQDLIKRFLFKSSNRQATSYNKNRQEPEFKVGDLVMRKDHQLSNAGRHFAAKLAKTYSGPYKILEQLSKNVFKLETANKKQCPKTHVRFLKKFIQPHVSGDSANQLAAMSNRDGRGARRKRDRRRRPKGCFNCGQNHDFTVCPNPQRVPVCGICGWRGVTKYHCPRPSCQRIISSGPPPERGRGPASRTTEQTPPQQPELRPPTPPTRPSTPSPRPPTSSPRPGPSSHPDVPTQSLSSQPSVPEIGSPEDILVIGGPRDLGSGPAVGYATITLAADDADPRVRRAYSLLDAVMFQRGYNLRGNPMGVAAYIPIGDYNPEPTDHRLEPPADGENLVSEAMDATSAGADAPEDVLQLHPDEEDELEVPELYDVVAAVEDWRGPYD